jgi:hypothetical protein
MINFLSDTALIESLMCGAQVRVPIGEKGQNFALLTVTLVFKCSSIITAM